MLVRRANAKRVAGCSARFARRRDGWCLLGVVLRPDWASIYHGEFALIVWNHAFGWWWDETPEESR